MKHPLLFEINGRIWLTSLRKKYKNEIDLCSVPEMELKQLCDLKPDYLWLMGVWQTGKKSIAMSRNHPDLQNEYRSALPDLTKTDITGSPYAIAGYKPARLFGSLSALKRFRNRLNNNGIKLVLDFIPNHTGLDHCWVHSHPEYYMQDSETGNYDKDIFNNTGIKIAHGKDPYFPEWSDTLQLDYSNADLQQKQIKTLFQLAQVCDGVRCDMAMLVTREVFYKTWQRNLDEEFWPAAISRVKEKFPDFQFLAEVYWDKEWDLQQMGFDFTYDKRLYDRLLSGQVSEILCHLRADIGFQNKSIRFTENHDQARAVVEFGREKSLAAATVVHTLPGMRFLHQGQIEGFRTKIPVQLNRMPNEVEDKEIKRYYEYLLHITSYDLFKKGQWNLEQCEDKRLLYWTWRLCASHRMVVVNYSDQIVETTIPLPTGYSLTSDIEFEDKLTGSVYQYRKDHLSAYGVFIKLVPFQSHIFSLKSIS